MCTLYVNNTISISLLIRAVYFAENGYQWALTNVN
jgi:hypothetical protein